MDAGKSRRAFDECAINVGLQQHPGCLAAASGANRIAHPLLSTRDAGPDQPALARGSDEQRVVVDDRVVEVDPDPQPVGN
ncbi:MAG: hypothetical protein WCE44_09595 [Candidatus Velthaea sp.]